MEEKKHIVHSFETDLSSLVNSLSALGEMVVSMIEFSQESLDKASPLLKEEAKMRDKKINELYSLIDDSAITILALRKPVAIDLRFVVAAIKIGALYEKMADRAKSIIANCCRINIAIPEDIQRQIIKMNSEIINMVTEINKNLLEYNFPKLKKVFDNDDKVDEYYDNLLKQIINSEKEICDNPASLVSLVYIIKSYERIGDYAIKIVRQLYYVQAGEIKTKL
ncbi:MAG: phosphate uptake regulator PhoU [Rickettsiales bacterium]|jgi:phosphate transport system protein|nr:phosphate uptake regulator PhoU [Rickettsiales bacterium]